MATLRKASAYRKVTRAYTRKSQTRKKGFIKTIPTHKIVRFHMGEHNKDYDYKLDLFSKDKIQIRHNAIESVRLLVNRRLVKKIGNNNYHLTINVFPHQILRENRMLTGAGADRMQTGMQQAFGKPMGRAAQIKKNQSLFSAFVTKEDLEEAKEALKLSFTRLPCKCGIEIKKI
ncbi:50S ribosomal protein L16 [archaeon]|nr:50S ribosomal protein L16 [archaeon]|tara:strand:+ start:215 stop:736 length:522 start_codon:yes stop_codon:yes gene_type:complete